jgi:magnesium-transporting ATPase (P-type)
MRDDGSAPVARNWHELPVDEVFAALNTSALGLGSDEAAARLRTHGPNRLPEAARRSPLMRFLSHFHNVLIYVLLGSAAVTASMGHVTDTLVILAVVVVNAVIGFVQEGKAERALESIHRMLEPHASVLRDGKRRTIDASELVPGDVVLLEAGEKVPADLRLFRAHGLGIQEAILTGESVPSGKNTHPVAAAESLGDRSCMAYSGTLVISGHGHGVVVATGAASEIGRISGLISDVEELTTPLVRQMNDFAWWLSILILLLAGVLLLYGYFVAHHDFSEMFMAVVGLSVAAIPEGLPAVLTITLAVGVQAMARRNAIVRRLPAIESIGSVSVICTDKTGTLTGNEMMVASVATRQHLFSVAGEGYAPAGAISLEGEPVDATAHADLAELSRLAALCNDAALHFRDGHWEADGDPMEGALLAFAGKAGEPLDRAKSPWTRTDHIPFDARHRFMATLHHDSQGAAILSVKGAPERLLAMCTTERDGAGGTAPLDKAYWTEVANRIAARGQRVLAFATGPVQPGQTAIASADVEHSLTLVGLVGLIDPPRPEAVAAVAECLGAGIRVKMITGDHAGTAMAIGRDVGLRNPDKVVTGLDIDRMSDGELAAAVLDTDIFARTSPEHKLRLVMALQSHGLSVAMTGDGVNDAAALKRADAGIAMGRKGSDAAKEAAQLVLADDNFASIAAAVREGRTVYDNIRKVISWTLPTNAGEAAVIMLALLFGLALPITPIQILWINLITAVTLGVALAFEPTEESTMRRPPRRRDEPIIPGALVWHIALVSALFLAAVFGIYAYAVDRGHSPDLARTIALNTIVVLEIFHLFFIRNIYGTSLTWKAVRGTRVVWATVAAVTAAQFAVTYLPPFQSVFATAAVPVFDGVLILAVGVVFFAIIEIEKQVRLLLVRRGAP